MRQDWIPIAAKFTDQDLIELANEDRLEIAVPSRLHQTLTRMSSYQLVAQALAERLQKANEKLKEHFNAGFNAGLRENNDPRQKRYL